MLRWMITLSALCLFAGGATAGDKPRADKGRGEALFKKMDTNGDGKLSKDEFAKFGENAKNRKGDASKGKARNPGAIFERLDADKDGYLSADEFKKLREMIAKKKQGK